MDQITREIMWQIPFSFKVIMYVLMFASVGVMIWGLAKQIKWASGGNIKSLLDKDGLNWSSFLQTIFFTGKVNRSRDVGIFHNLIYYGFIILLIATELVAIHADTPFKVYKGPVYIVVSFLADLAGILILIGLSLAYYRRYIKKPDYLSATKPKREIYMYSILVALVVLGYVIEGFRIIGAGMPAHEATYSPIGWLMANFFLMFHMSDDTLISVYKALWMLHMINTMVFIATIPYSKFSHFIYAPLSALITPFKRAGILQPMDFEDETKETFGLGKLSELTSKMKLDTLSCVECGRCTQVCPANLAGRPLNPKTIITKIRDTIHEAKGEDADFWEKQTFSSIELDSCTTCGACVEECPMSIEHIQPIMELKRYKALTLGDIPPEAATAVNNIRVNGNPWGVSQDDRFKWADGLDVPVAEPQKKIDFLYYVGCAGSYDNNNQKVVQDTVTLLKKAGVNFAVMGKTEKCNGDPIRRFGDEYSFFEVAIENIANLRQYDFDKVVTHCPHCLHTIGKEYAKFEDGEFETIHHTELLAELVRSGKLQPKKEIKEELTFHDPCYLGRHHGEYNAPREVLNSIPGITIKEMKQNKEKSLCCGMGGGNMWYEVHEGGDLAENRLKHVGETKAYKLATSCSFCMINFHSGKAKVKETEDLEIQDVASILKSSIEE